MNCERVTFPGGVAIVCGSRTRKRCSCGRRATLECDWKVPERTSGTCDAPICGNCTTSPAPGKDLCPSCTAKYEQWKMTRNG